MSSDNDRRVAMFNSMMRNGLTPEQAVAEYHQKHNEKPVSLADRMAKIVADSKKSKSYTDKGEMPPGFEEATKHMSDKDKANMLVLMDNVATNSEQIQTKKHADGGQEILIPLSLFHGMK